MKFVEGVKQIINEWRLDRQHRAYLKQKLEDLVDPTFLDRATK